MSQERIRRLSFLVLPLGFLAAFLVWPRQRDFHAAERQGRTYAFLVACQDYDRAELKPLKYTRDDMVALAKTLLDGGIDKDHIVLLHDKQEKDLLPEAKKIRRQLKVLLAGLRDKDTLIVGLSGHGIQFKGEDGAYFCPVDAELKDRSTLIGLDELYKELKKCKARRKLLLVDACRNDPQSEAGKSREEVSLEKLTGLQNQPVPEGVVALFSCSKGEQSFEDAELKHGVFFHHILKGWQGEAADKKGRVTLNSLADYVIDETPTYARLHFKRAQVPQQKGELSGVWVLRQAAVALAPTITNSIGMKLVLVPAGKFTMGSPESEKDRESFVKGSEKQHEVEITRAFYMGAYVVTQEEYEKVMGKNPSFFTNARGRKTTGMDTRRFPVEGVIWKDAQEFCEKLTALEKRKGLARDYRLPTEAEWEYACREAGKSTTPFYFGSTLSSEQANFNGEHPYGGADRGPYLERTSKVGSYKPNKLGLYDMHGNVLQWCNDWYDKDYYANSDIKDPQGPKAGDKRVQRGGSCHRHGDQCRAANRDCQRPAYTGTDVGFRVVCVVRPRTR